MRVEIDTHTHTLASGHAYNTMNEMAKAAADKGIKALRLRNMHRRCQGPVICTIFRI